MTEIKCFGDTLGDGRVQISFSLPVPLNSAGKISALDVCRAMNLVSPMIASAQSLGKAHTFFICYGTLDVEVAFDQTEERQQATKEWTSEDVLSHFGRKLIIVAASTGTDAHTVGLNAILSRKGYGGDPGLESYACFQIFNLGSQVPNDDVVVKCQEVGADAVLISQFVTEKGLHLENLADLFEKVQLLNKVPLMIAGGPRLVEQDVKEIGFNAVFGPGTLPSHVFAYITETLSIERS